MTGSTIGVVNEAFYFIAAFSFLLLFGIVFLMVYFLVRYRQSRNPVATEIHGNAWLEALWVVLPTLLALAMFGYGLTGYRFLRSPPAGALEVTVHSRQWSWLFEYPNGSRSPDLVVPEGRDVRLTLTSDDVIHAFYVPAFRIQVDTVPGMKTQAWFHGGSVGSYDILCAQYCGQGHSAMLAKLYVVPAEDYSRWYGGGIVELAGTKLPSAHATGVDLLTQRGCLSCHSLDGTKKVGPTFKGLFGSRVEVYTNGVERELVADESYIRSSILDPGADIVDGYSNIMPTGAGQLSDAELDDIVGTLKTLK
ncbi:MAG TPA: cytochrome c oxidase subunit II [Rectinemataceae bacterium]|nr:cytochrome c oxidase subunit II [Rectinemataceae bacterium]